MNQSHIEKRFGLIGQNIAHSLSPKLFKAAYPDETKQKIYRYNLIEAPSIKNALSIVIGQKYSGINITTPYKAEIMKCASWLDPLSKKIGASNLALIRENKLLLYNTDYYGALESIKPHIQQQDKVMIMGIGGAGKAAAIAIQDLGNDCLIVNRTIDSITDFAQINNFKYASIQQAVNESKNYSILINTSSGKIDLPDLFLTKFRLIMEANYADPKIETYCMHHGIKYISGIEWLINQAIQSFILFTGNIPDTNALRFAVSTF